MYYYFAYGSNMNREQMSFRCPDAVMVGRGRLHNYTLLERQHADIRYWPGHVVHGVVWRVSRRDIAALDRYEGYPTYYVHYRVPVKTRSGYKDCLTYMMSIEARQQRDNIPFAAHYREICRTGAEENGLPVHELYLDNLVPSF